VESAVECAGAGCSVVAIRPSELKHLNTNLTNLGFISEFDEFCIYLMRASSAELHEGISLALELYIGDPDSAPQAGFISPNITEISASDLGIRLQQVINTYWFGSYDPVSMMGVSDASLYSIFRATIFTGLEHVLRSRLFPGPLFLRTNFFANSLKFLNLTTPDDSLTLKLTLNTTAINIVFNDVYILHFGWFFALLLATTTALGAALVGAFFSWRIKGPDILGHFSTLLRDTPYASAVKAGTTMDGLERTRRQRSIKAKLLDVDPDNEVGYIAEDFGGSGGRLMWGRYYW
jgi:hypothetical protein